MLHLKAHFQKVPQVTRNCESWVYQTQIFTLHILKTDFFFAGDGVKYLEPLTSDQSLIFLIQVIYEIGTSFPPISAPYFVGALDRCYSQIHPLHLLSHLAVSFLSLFSLELSFLSSQDNYSYILNSYSKLSTLMQIITFKSYMCRRFTDYISKQNSILYVCQDGV